MNTSTLRDRVRALDIFGISQLIRTRRTIYPDDIESFDGVVVHHVVAQEGITAVFDAFDRSEPAPTARVFEYRWKVVALDAGGDRIAEIYASAISPFGMFDEMAIRFSNSDFVDYLTRSFATVDASLTATE